MPGHPVVAGQGVQQLQACVRSPHHRHGQGAVQGGHRVGGDAVEQLVQGEDLRPVGLVRGGRFVVDRGDGRLDLVSAHWALGQRVGDQGDALGDRGLVPAAAILVGKRHQLPGVVDPGGAAGLGEQHQREEPGDLAVAGPEPVQPAGQPQRFSGQVDAVHLLAGRRGVALVEDQVQHVADGLDPLINLLGGWHRERRAGLPDTLLGPADPLRHGRFGHEEGAGDLGRGQAPDRPQRQRDLRGRCERRMAAQQQQRERVIPVRLPPIPGIPAQLGRGRAEGQAVLSLAPGTLAADLVDQPPRGDGDQPGPGVLRYPLGRPVHGGGQQRLLHGVLA